MIKAGLSAIGIICLICLIILVALFGLAQQLIGGGTGIFSSIVTAAKSLQAHVHGSRSNLYDIHDPFMQPILGYWARSCPGNGPGGICALAESGNLQCVEFVTAAYWLGGDPLPAAPNAEQFWDTYAHQPGWQQIPSPSAFPGTAKQAPNLGDLMVFKEGAHLENGRLVEFGHIGIVVGFNAPSADADGSIEIAQGNGPGTKLAPLSLSPWVANDKPGNTYMMTVHPDYTIATWGPYSFSGLAYGGMTVLGFLHDAAFAQKHANARLEAHAQSLPQGLSFSMPYVQEAWNDATSVGIPPGYFVRQISAESSFNPNAASRAGAIGIAQFMPSTAAGLPNPFTGQGTLNPWDPNQALLAAAQLMAHSVLQYQGNYAKALAAYNGGQGQVTSAERQAADTGQPDQWMNYLSPESRQYIQTITGL